MASVAHKFEMPDSIAGESPVTIPITQNTSARESSDVRAIEPQIFASLQDAIDSYQQFIETCNWKRNPTLASFVWMSEHNWVVDDETGDDVRLQDDDPDFYSVEAWTEDMLSMTDNRWKMVDDELVAYEATRDDIESADESVDAIAGVNQAAEVNQAADAAVDASLSLQAEANHDEKFWREMEIIAELRAAEIKRQEAQTAFDIATEERKEAKEHLASCAASVARITAKLVGLTLQANPAAAAATPTPAKPAASSESTSDPEQLAKPEVAQPSVAEPEPSNVGQGGDDNSWRIKSTAELIKGLPGLGKKKLDDIVSLCPTVGDLEDKRAEASKDCLPFKAALPKGCGEQIANAIEDALLKHIAEFGQQVPKAKPVDSLDDL